MGLKAALSSGTFILANISLIGFILASHSAERSATSGQIREVLYTQHCIRNLKPRGMVPFISYGPRELFARFWELFSKDLEGKQGKDNSGKVVRICFFCSFRAPSFLKPVVSYAVPWVYNNFRAVGHCCTQCYYCDA